MGCDDDGVLLVLDVDAPGVALVSVGLASRGGQLKGDRVTIHDRSFPLVPTPQGYLPEGLVDLLADWDAAQLEWFCRRSVVLHVWLHGGRVYANYYIFDDAGSSLPNSSRRLGPRGQRDRLIASGHIHGGAGFNLQV